MAEKHRWNLERQSVVFLKLLTVAPIFWRTCPVGYEWAEFGFKVFLFFLFSGSFFSPHISKSDMPGTPKEQQPGCIVFLHQNKQNNLGSPWERATDIPWEKKMLGVAERSWQDLWMIKKKKKNVTKPCIAHQSLANPRELILQVKHRIRSQGLLQVSQQLTTLLWTQCECIHHSKAPKQRGESKTVKALCGCCPCRENNEQERERKQSLDWQGKRAGIEGIGEFYTTVRTAKILNSNSWGGKRRQMKKKKTSTTVWPSSGRREWLQMGLITACHWNEMSGKGAHHWLQCHRRDKLTSLKTNRGCFALCT